MSAAPAISVLMPVYNQTTYLFEAIDSILNQNYSDFEFIIIDDHSTDVTPHLLEGYRHQDPRICVVRNETTLGVANSLNRGLALARGRYIARMDSDDISFPERFEKQVAFLEEHPRLGVLGTQTCFIDEAGELSQQANWEKPVQHNLLLWHLLFATPICHPSVMLRTDCLRCIGGYDASYPNEDMHLWTQMAWVTKLANLDEVLLHYRVPIKIHHQKQIVFAPYVQQVSREYAERLLKRELDPRLFQILFTFQHFRRLLEEKVTLADAYQMGQLLSDIFQALQDQGLFDLDDLAPVERLLFQQTQELIAAVFETQA